MKKIITVIATSLCFAFVAGATDIPQSELFLGYNFVRFNPNSNFIPSINANGGSGQFVWNFYKGLGIAVDMGAVTKGVINQTDIDTTVAHLLAGPRYKFHQHSRYQPFVEALFGGAYATASTQIFSVPTVSPLGLVDLSGAAISTRLVASRSSFALMSGGGLDIKVSKHMQVRPVAFDYYLTRPASLITGDNSNRNNWRYSAGVLFTFGAQ
jgi:hypothetical protein